MNAKPHSIYEFGPFRLEVAERRLLRDGEVVSLSPRLFDLLAVLVERHGRLLEKDELLRLIWPDSFVEEANLNVNVSALRRALGDTPSAPRYIETVPRRGYRFVGEVREAAAGEEVPGEEVARPPAPAAEPAPPLRRRAPGRAAIAMVVVALVAVVVAVAWRFGTQSDRQSGLAGLRTIAVLPFTPLGEGTSDATLELGMADALITKLSNLPEITVRPTSAVAKYSEVRADPLEAGREMQVDAVLEGRVQRAGDRIRVTVQLVRVSDGAPLWADRFDDYFTNIFAVQDSISERMAEALRLRLTPDLERRIAKRHTESVEAYQLYLQGRYFAGKMTPDSLARSIELYDAALATDPDYPLAYASLAEANLNLARYGVDAPAAATRARAAAEKALAMDPVLSDGYYARGSVAFDVDWNFPAAERDLKRAIELNPRHADARTAYASLLTALGRHDEAIREIEEARRLDPVSQSVLGGHVVALIEARRLDEAVATARAAVDLDPRSLLARRELAEAYIAKGMYAEAIAECEKEVDLGGLKAKPAILGYAYARAGRRADAEAILAERRRDLGQPGVTNYGIALVYAGLGDREQALAWLEKAVAAHEAPVAMLNVDAYWDDLRPDPRFAALARRVGLAT